VKFLVTQDIHARNKPEGMLTLYRRVIRSTTIKAIAEGCSVVFHGGDLIHEKHSVLVELLIMLFQEFEWARKQGVNWVLIPGNHDIPAKHQPTKSILYVFSKVAFVYLKPKRLKGPGWSVYLNPWRLPEEFKRNSAELAKMSRMDNSAFKLQIGHIGLAEGTMSPSNTYRVPSPVRVPDLYPEQYTMTIHNGPNLFIHTIDAVGNESGEHALNDHTDTDFPSPADGDTIVWDDGAGMWVSAAGPAPGPHTLGSHSDTTFSSLATNDVVKWDGSGWVNGPVAAGPHTIIGSSHSDSVATGSLANNQVLTYDSGLSKWTNKAVPVPALDNLSNVSTVGKAVGDFLWWTGAAWANRAIRLDDLFDVNAPTPATNQALIWNGLAWVPGNPTVAMAVPYWGGYLSLLSPPTWTAYSTGGGAYTLNRVGGPSGWIFWTPPVSGTYEMIVTGSITFTPGGSNGSFGIYLNNTGGPLGQPGIIGTSPLGSMTIAAHAVAYLSGGNVMGFAMSAGGGGSIGAVYLNLTIKRIGD